MANFSGGRALPTLEATQPFSHPAIVSEILRCEVGSTAHGVSLADNDDLDLAGVYVERPEYLIGLGSFETHIYRTAAEREHKHDARSQPGDVDLTLHSLRKFCRLAIKGNPTILLMFFAPTKVCTLHGSLLRERAIDFLSVQAGKHYLGYMKAQRERMLGLRGQKDVKRLDLVEKYGFDTKYAMHMLRLGLQGAELLATGKLSVPMSAEHRSYLIGIRTGQYTEKEVSEHGIVLEQQLEYLLSHSVLPIEPNIRLVNALLAEIYFELWNSSKLF